jgi:hypothetical protein
MKKTFTLITLLVSYCVITAQESKNPEILIVYLNPGWNKEKKVNFYTINPDAGVAAAAELYNLKSVRDLLPDENDPHYNKIKKERFNSINSDSIIYNYFETESAALNFIISKKWKLFSVLPQIVTSNGGIGDGSYGNTTSIPKYLFVRAE